MNNSDPSGLAWYDIFNPWSPNNPIRENAQNGGLPSQLIQTFDPAYLAISGYMNEAQAAENGCGFWTEAKYGAEGVLGVAGTELFGLGGAGAVGDLFGGAAEEGPAIAEDNAGHIFRDAPGHLAEDTPENRAVIEGTVSPGNYVGTDSNGVATYREMLPDGQQAWAEVYGGQITNGGVNNAPR